MGGVTQKARRGEVRRGVRQFTPQVKSASDIFIKFESKRLGAEIARSRED